MPMFDDLREAIGGRARLARDGFMTTCVDAVPTGRVAPFEYNLIPVPAIRHMQWDHGDNTSRALRAWFGVRQMLGVTDCGAEIEAGLWQHLRALVSPETGMACVPEYSHLPQGPRYYHTWDQGRLFDYLVLRWSEIAGSAGEKLELLDRIRQLQTNLKALSQTAVQHDGTVARWWPAEVYYDDAPQPSAPGFAARGPEDFRDWCIGCSQFLPPQVRLAALTGETADLELALEMARGFLAGCERRRGSTAPMFAADGKFYGHFHCAVSGLDGVLQLATLLYRRGETPLASEWIELAIRVYRWILHGESNVNRGSSCGCFPESACDTPHVTSELCCVADMLELAIHLAECASLHPRWAALSDLWDDVERYLRNEVFKTQLTRTAPLASLLRWPTNRSKESVRELLDRQQGLWICGRPFLNDLITYERPENLRQRPALKDLAVDFGSQPVIPELHGGGCCAYSGVRALHAVWQAAVAATPGTVEIRIPMSYANGDLTVTPLVSGEGLRILTRNAQNVRIRIPCHAGQAAVKLTAGSHQWRDGQRWLELALPPGADAVVSWTLNDWTAQETFGPLNANGAVPGVGRGERVTCTLRYHGPELIQVEPAGMILPYEQGL